MCYDDNARPPVPPISGGAADGQDIVLTAPDGNRFSAYIAYSAQTDGPQVLIYPDIRGLHQFYKELALRFAEVGIRALAIDYFGRTAGLTSRAEPFAASPVMGKRGHAHAPLPGRSDAGHFHFFTQFAPEDIFRFEGVLAPNMGCIL